MKKNLEAATKVIDDFYTLLDEHLKERNKEVYHRAKKAEKKLYDLEKDEGKQVEAQLLNFLRQTYTDNTYI